MRRADDVDSGRLGSDPLGRAAWNFSSSRSKARWMRGVGGEAELGDAYYNSLAPPPVEQGAMGGRGSFTG